MDGDTALVDWTKGVSANGNFKLVVDMPPGGVWVCFFPKYFMVGTPWDLTAARAPSIPRGTSFGATSDNIYYVNYLSAYIICSSALHLMNPIHLINTPGILSIIYFMNLVHKQKENYYLRPSSIPPTYLTT